MKKLAQAIMLCSASVLLLTGCVSREHADAKLAKACEAGVNVVLPEGRKITRVAKTDFSPATEGPAMRHVKLTAIETDGFLEIENAFDCVFEESSGFLNSNHTASVYYVRAGDRMIGKSGNEIIGSAAEFMELNDAMRDAMYK